MRLVILGPQGAGKGTQAKKLSEKHDIPHIATGDIFRWAIRQGDELGREVKDYVDDGKLVPDGLTLRVVSERLESDDAQRGWILDGFPRNLEQAEGLHELMELKGRELDKALVIEVPEEVSLRRTLGRRVCENCGATYHQDRPPTNDWTCDRCGGNVVPRSDDSEAKIRDRLATYHERTEPLKEYYKERGQLLVVDGTGSPEEVFDKIVEGL
jgi:adenylate kinase